MGTPAEGSPIERGFKQYNEHCCERLGKGVDLQRGRGEGYVQVICVMKWRGK